jgi:two-component system response regulator RegA
MKAHATPHLPGGTPPRGHLLVIDDDATWRAVVGRALASRGYEVLTAESAAIGLQLADTRPLAGAIVDLRLPDESGLEAVARLHALDPDLPIVVLTGYASIATAVEAIKLGATHYLAKPVEVDAILQALGQRTGDARVAMSYQPLSVERLEWEYIQKILIDNSGNLSATARTLRMHRRTLQRKLAKRPPRG